MKKRFISMIVIVAMLCMLLPQMAVYASVSASDIDAAITTAGGLADKGNLYISASSLMQSIEIEGTEYPLTYSVDNTNVIDAQGNVTHGMKPVYVTVTPQISVEGSVIEGSEKKLLVLPKSTLIKDEFFEDFEGEAYAPEEGQREKAFSSNGTYGKFTAGTISQYAQITVKTDDTRYLEVRTNSGGTSSGHIAPSIKAAVSSDVFAKGISSVLAMRVKFFIGGASGSLSCAPFFTAYSSNATNKQYYFYASNSFGTKTNTTDISNNEWNDYLFIRKNGSTPEETETEVFINGESKGIFTGERGSLTEFAISLSRAQANYADVDDILLFGLENTIFPDMELTDGGKMYVSRNQLPQTVIIEGTEYPIAYITDNESVISASGEVTHQKNYTYVTVTPTTIIDGTEVKGKTQKLLVFPSVYDTLFDENFENFDVGTFERGATINGWTSNTYTGRDHIVQEIRSDDVHGKYIYLGAENPQDMGSTNPLLQKAFSGSSGYEGKTLIGWRMLANPYTDSNGITTNIAQFNTTNIIDGNGSKFSYTNYTGQWHNFIFEIDNEDTVTTNAQLMKKVTMYVDGEYINSFYTRDWSDRLYITLYRNYNQSVCFDDFFAINLTGLIAKLPEVNDLKLANLGNSYVNQNLPTTVKINDTDYTVSYETTVPDVINAQGEIVQKDYDYGTSIVTPYITVEGENGETVVVRGTRTALTVLPKHATTTISEDFEGAYIGQKLSLEQAKPNRYNMWYGNAQANNEKVRAVVEEENITETRKNKYFSFEVNTPGGKENPIIVHEKDYKDIEGTITATSLRVKYKSSLRVHIDGLGYITASRIENSSMEGMLNYATTSLKAGEWTNITFIKNSITLKIKLYINGEYQGEYTYKNSGNNFTMYVYRNTSGDVCIDDLIVQRMTDIPHLETTRAALDLGDVANVTENISLPKSADGNVAISWSKNCDDDVAQIVDGTLFVKRSQTTDQSFVLTATLSTNGTEVTRDFNVTIKKIRQIELNALTFKELSGSQKETAVTNNLSLPNSCAGGAVSITWESLTDNLTNNGAITRELLDKKGVLKALYSGYGDTFVKIYTFTIRGTGEILYEGGFDEATEGASVDTLSGWNIGGTEDKHQEKSVDSIVIKDPRDALLSYEDARKVLKVNRFATKNDRAVSNDKAMLTFDEKFKRERTAYDFDFCITEGRVLVELFDMQMTFAITRTGVSRYGYETKQLIAFDEPLGVGEWHHATIVQDAYLGKYDFYLDYEYLGSQISKGTKGIKGINFYSNAVSSTVYDTFFIANLLIKDVTPKPQACVSAGIRDLILGSIDYDRARITLPDHSSESTYVEWKSSHPEIISETGLVNRQSTPKTVTLTATVSKGDYMEEKEFTLTVDALTTTLVPTEEIMSVIAEDLTFDMISDESHLKVTKDLNLISSFDFGKAREIGGINITWVSDTPYTISNDGTYRKAKYEKAIKLTATITSVTNSNVSVTKEFLVVPMVDAVVHEYWDFEDCTEETVGENVQEWTTLTRRAFTSETEYGLRQYVDKAPGEEHLPLDKANKVLYMDRAINKSMGTIPSLDYLNYQTPTEESRRELENAGNAILSFKLMLTNPKASIPMTIHVMAEQTTYLYNAQFLRTNPKPDLTATFENPMESNKWYEVTFFFDLLSHRMDVYVDGVRAGSEPFDVPWGHSQFRSFRIFNDSLDPFYLDDISIRYLKPESGENAVIADANALTLDQNITEDITLPTVGEMGSSIIWESSNPEVITGGGKLFPSSAKDLKATLTANVCYNNALEKRTFNVNIPRNASVPYEISNIKITNNVLNSVGVTENTAQPNNELMVLIYDKGRLVAVKTFDGVTTGDYALNYDLSQYKNYKVTAFVWNKTKVLSDKKTIDWR